jgi:hypothetical protein
MCALVVGTVVWSGSACSGTATSANFRLIGSAPASTSAISVSPVYQLYVVGGSGQPVGISVSTNNSVVTGGTSNQLPTDRMFMDGLEN